MKNGLDQNQHAIAWGEHLARCFLQKFGNDLGAALQAMAIRLVIAPEDRTEFPLPRFAVWEGDTRTIRIFQKPLRQKFSDWNFALRRACTHELFHALVAERCRSLSFSSSPPAFSHRAAEIAAEAFSHFAARNFRLTLEGDVRNFE